MFIILVLLYCSHQLCDWTVRREATGCADTSIRLQCSASATRQTFYRSFRRLVLYDTNKCYGRGVRTATKGPGTLWSN